MVDSVKKDAVTATVHVHAAVTFLQHCLCCSHDSVWH